MSDTTIWYNFAIDSFSEKDAEALKISNKKCVSCFSKKAPNDGWNEYKERNNDQFLRLLSVLPQCSTVCELLIEDLDLKHVCVVKLCQALNGATINLKTLSINRIYFEDTKKGVKELFSALINNTSLLHFKFEHREFKHEQTCFYMSRLAELLKYNTTLKTLSFNAYSRDLSRLWDEEGLKKYLHKGCEGGSEVNRLKNLKGFACLKVLILSFCQIQDDEAQSLAKNLIYNVNLTHLDLGYNRINDAGGIKIAESLKKNDALIILRLNENQLTNKTADMFAQVLRKDGNRKLCHLWLSGNKIGTGIMSKMKKALIVNTVLLSVRLWEWEDRDSPKYKCQNAIDDLLTKNRERNAGAFSKANQSEATAPWLRSKLMVVGQGAAGKTSILRSLLRMPFTDKCDSTIGVDLTEVVTTSGSNWKIGNTEDFANNFVHQLAAESVKREEREYYERQAAPAVQRVKYNVKQKVKEVKQKANAIIETPTVQSALRHLGKTNKTEEVHEEPLFEYNAGLLLGNLNTKIRMSIWDYGGQKVFYTLHHVFLTQYGVYLIVFNMAKVLEFSDESKEYLLFWLNSIKLHAPNAPVILVGTFLDLLKDDKGEDIKQLEQVTAIVNELCSDFPQVRHVENLAYCPTSNVDKSGVERLRDAIEHETENADFVQTPVSLKWLQALDILVGSSEKAIEKPWVRLSELEEKLQDIGIERDEEIQRMLCLFHELGVVLYFSSCVRLREAVIGKPEWLLKKVSMVIRDKEIHTYNPHDLADVETNELSKDLDLFMENGIASRDLLDYIWNTLLDESQGDYLIELMRHLLLLSDWNFSTEERYLIPSMLPVTKASTEPIKGKLFKLEFEFLPQGVFERLCCLCVDYSSSLSKATSPELYKTISSVDLGEKGLTQISVSDNQIIVTLSDETQAATILDFFLRMIARIQIEFMQGGLQWQVLVEDGEALVTYEDAKKRQLEPWVKPIHDDATSKTVAIEKLLDL